MNRLEKTMKGIREQIGLDHSFCESESYTSESVNHFVAQVEELLLVTKNSRIPKVIAARKDVQTALHDLIPEKEELI